MKTTYLLGVDIGTSGTKTVLFDTEGAAIADATVEYPLYQNVISWNVEPGWLRSVCTVVNCSPSGGHPRRKSKDGEGQETGSQASEVIGSSAVYTFYTGTDNKENSYSSSALTFERQAETRWQVNFIRKNSEHLLVEVLERG